MSAQTGTGGAGVGASLLLLTWSAGVLDAITYLDSRVFIANMTGTTVLLGIDTVRWDPERLFPAAVALTSFALGVLIGAVALKQNPEGQECRGDMRIGIGLALPLLAAYGVLWAAAPGHAGLLIAIAATAMGIQSVAVRRLRIRGVVTTFITGTITAAISEAVSGKDRKPGAEEHTSGPGLLAAMFCVYVLAAGCGAALYDHHGALAAWLPACAAGIVELRSLN